MLMPLTQIISPLITGQVCSGSGWDLVTFFCPRLSFLLLRCELDFVGNTDLIRRGTLVFLIYFFESKVKDTRDR